MKKIFIVILIGVAVFLLGRCFPNAFATAEFYVIIDPGHGGRDGGASQNGIYEKDINLSISKKLNTYLEGAGIRTMMLRSGDYGLYNPNDANKHRADILKRVSIINSSNCDLFVSIHLNTYPDEYYHGAQAFYYPGKEASKEMAEILQKNLIEVLQNTDRKTKAVKNIYLLKNTNKPGVLVEAGFMTNQDEFALLNQTAYQDKIAFAIYCGILETLNCN